MNTTRQHSPLKDIDLLDWLDDHVPEAPKVPQPKGIHTLEVTNPRSEDEPLEVDRPHDFPLKEEH